MANQNDFDRELDHEYDGIKEYDNPLPRWWVGILVGTMAWSAWYIPNYALEAFGDSESPDEAWAAEMKAWEVKHPQVKLASAEELVGIVGDNARAERGKEIWKARCAACHRADGGGLVGPNLTDDKWIHGSKPEQLVAVIFNGVPEKGMLAWKSQLNVEQIYDVAAYVRTLRGSNPANPKAPEGALE
jgi:cytochrome c oxidase cbb3-type subunit 3